MGQKLLGNALSSTDLKITLLEQFRNCSSAQTTRVPSTQVTIDTGATGYPIK